MMAARFAFLGLGQIGQAMSQNLLRYGNIAKPLTLYNRTKSTAEAHATRLGDCRVSESVTDAVAGADIVWLCVQDEEAVESIFQQIFTIPVRGKLFVDSSTVTGEKADSIAERVAEAGASFVAIPVMGGHNQASSRTLTCIVGGPTESVDRIRPYLENVVCKNVVDLSGETPGTAMKMKLMGNFLILATMETVAEVNVLAEKCGLGTERMNQLMSAIFPNPPHAVYNRRMLTGAYHTEIPMVKISAAIELANHVRSLAKESGASTKLYDVAYRHLEKVEEAEGPGADITGIYGAVRMESGLPFRNATQLN